jgi:hypothetical protein
MSAREKAEWSASLHTFLDFSVLDVMLHGGLGQPFHRLDVQNHAVVSKQR